MQCHSRHISLPCKNMTNIKVATALSELQQCCRTAGSAAALKLCLHWDRHTLPHIQVVV